MKKHKALKIVLISLGAVFALVISFIGGVLIFASATTLKVKDVEKMQVNGLATAEVNANETIKVMTWNTGYGALDERQDCCWDGGKGVYGKREAGKGTDCVGRRKECVHYGSNLDALSADAQDD